MAAPAETPPAAAMTETPPAEAPAAASDKPVVITGDEVAKSGDEPADRRWVWIVVIAIVVIGVFLLMRKRRAQQ
jgi:hypothetical protein